MAETVWYDGTDNYKKCTFIEDSITKNHTFNIEFLTTTVQPYNSIIECYADLLSNRQTKFVDILYSGGLDSELVLYSCLINKTPARAITMRLLIRGCPVNMTDLYYSEKFCRANNVEQILIDIDAEKFLESGRHIDYLKKYFITEPHVATHFWLAEQCSGFPVLGGDYTWPWVFKPLISPHRHHYSQYDRFFKDNNMHGIGNIMSHCLSGNIIIMNAHISLMQNKFYQTDYKNISIFKRDLFESLGYKSPEIRLRSDGWESIPKLLLDMTPYRIALQEEFGITTSSISWNEKINELIKADVRYNDKFR